MFMGGIRNCCQYKSNTSACFNQVTHYLLSVIIKMAKLNIHTLSIIYYTWSAMFCIKQCCSTHIATTALFD